MKRKEEENCRGKRSALKEETEYIGTKEIEGSQRGKEER